MNRRRRRSFRITVALVLLGLAGLLVAAAVVIGGAPLLAIAAVSTWVAGATAARMMSNELAQTRRDAARDRSAQALAYQQMATEQARSNSAFAAAMTATVAGRDVELAALAGTLRLSEARADEAVERGRRHALRVDELQTRVDELAAELDRAQEEQVITADELAVWDDSQAPTVVDLLTWEERRPTGPAIDEAHAQA